MFILPLYSFTPARGRLILTLLNKKFDLTIWRFVRWLSATLSYLDAKVICAGE